MAASETQLDIWTSSTYDPSPGGALALHHQSRCAILQLHGFCCMSFCIQVLQDFSPGEESSTLEICGACKAATCIDVKIASYVLI